ncbi:MAG: hypothetical protein AB7Q16_18095 [Vicinamibacterales bacterium]
MRHVLAVALAWSTVLAAQPGRDDAVEAALKRAIQEDPGELRHRFALADYHQRAGRRGPADQVLRESLVLDPLSRDIFERRLLLFAEPLQPARVGAIALEWLLADGTALEPLLIATGHRLRRASARRADGTDFSLVELDRALFELDGAMPLHPEESAIHRARAAVLLARSTLVESNAEREAHVREAARADERAPELEANSGGPHPSGRRVSAIVAAMSTVPPFGPPGAVRAGPGGVVPEPRRLKAALPPRPSPRRGERRRVHPIELVIDPAGRVVQVHPLDTVDGYTNAVAEAMTQWVYEPTVVSGVPVPVILVVSAP